MHQSLPYSSTFSPRVKFSWKALSAKILLREIFFTRTFYDAEISRYGTGHLADRVLASFRDQWVVVPMTSLVPRLLPSFLSHTVQKTGREPGRFDHVRDDVLCVVLCVVLVIELPPTHAVLARCQSRLVDIANPASAVGISHGHQGTQARYFVSRHVSTWSTDTTHDLCTTLKINGVVGPTKVCHLKPPSVDIPVFML